MAQQASVPASSWIIIPDEQLRHVDCSAALLLPAGHVSHAVDSVVCVDTVPAMQL